MRFLPNGLNIPDELLEERDKGNVVFLCGAGVSKPAGMPDFLKLAEYVTEELGALPDSQSRTMLAMWKNEKIPSGGKPPLDQIFNLLQQEYAPNKIDYLIAKRLKTEPETSVSAHETVLRLSKGANSKPQIVTTNFDLLFEKAAGQTLETYVSPKLPDLASEESFDGLVYLHGRIDPGTERGGGRQELVISSSDFGRAYLAEGWATRFIRDLLNDRYILVLVGYRANDPPVRYLLQGLHTRRRGNRARLFAFDSGTEEEVQPRWRGSGVRALAYPAPDASHSALWDTLSAWADRADDPLAWRHRIVDLARKGPRNLAPCERGQVASLVRTDIGARLFANADPPPPSEWLCVFDHNFRYGEVGVQSNDSQPDFDPLIEYGLDDDPPRPRPPRNYRQIDPPGDDLLSLKPTDRRINGNRKLTGNSRQWPEPLSHRLSHLVLWIGKIAHEPVAPWWAARYSSLHPDLLGELERWVKQADDELPCSARLTWRLLIEKFYTAPDNPDFSWYETLEHIKTEGWTNGVLRAFDRRMTPYIETEPPRYKYGVIRPPEKDWSELNLVDIAQFKVKFHDIHNRYPEIPIDALPAVYQIVRRHLEIAMQIQTDIGTCDSTLIFPDKHRKAYLCWFRSLIDRMVEAHPRICPGRHSPLAKRRTCFL